LAYKLKRRLYTVQSAVFESTITPDTICIPVECPVCNRSHLVNPARFIQAANAAEPKIARHRESTAF
jgi:hypothetical protein